MAKNMNSNRMILILPVLMVVAIILGTVRCERPMGTNIPPTDTIHKPMNAVYYWRTSFKLSDNERTFLEKEKIGRMYLRMFDVTDGYPMAVPNASLTIVDSMPEGIEIVPTVFVTVDAMKQMINLNKVDVLAEKIVKRVEAMCEWNNINNWHEIQLDCDWTATTRGGFFRLCKEVKKRTKGKLVSSTIRLHQLTQEAPPVDYGVLMVYNTDRFGDFDTKNSILNDTTVELYLKKEMTFDLPLDIALPIFQWDIVFQNEKFVKIAKYYESGQNDREVVRHEGVTIETLMKTQQLLNEYLRLESHKHSTVLYYLDSVNINSYSYEDLKTIYIN